MTARLAVLCDVHGNATALEAVRKALKTDKPDAVIVAGDLVMNGPEPSAAIDALRAMEADGATIVQGNTDVAVADFDYAAAFPWFTDGVPDAHRAAAEWAHDELGDERARLAAAARRRSGGSCSTTRWSSPATRRRGRRRRASIPARPLGRARAHLPHRRPGHLLRPHPPAGRPRPRLEADRQRRLGGLRLRRRPDRLVGARSTSTATR